MKFNSESLRFEPPTLSEAELARALYLGWGLEGQLRPLSGERDQNRLVKTKDGKRFVLKVSSLVERREIVKFQTQALRHLEQYAGALALPRVISSIENGDIVDFQSDDGRIYYTRLLTFVDGKPMEEFAAQVQTEKAAMLGKFMGTVCGALTSFQFDLGDYVMPWDVSKGLILSPQLHNSGFGDVEALVLPHLDYFKTHLLDKVPSMRQQIIHNDAHPGNVLLDNEGNRLAGLIDFGDMVHAPVVQECAVPMSKLMALSDQPIEVGADFVRAFHAQMPLEENEMGLLFDFILLRAGLTILIADYCFHQYALGNFLTKKDYKQTVTNFLRLRALDKAKVVGTFQSALLG